MEILKFIFVGLAVGAVSSALGIGGGVLLLPVMIYFLEFEHEKAAGTGYVVLLPAVTILAWLYYSRGLVYPKAALWLAQGFAVGAVLGALALLSPLFPKEYFRIALGFLLVYVGFRFVLSSDDDAHGGLVGLALMAGSFVVYVALKCVGRTYRVKALAEAVSRAQQQAHRDPDYYI